VARALHASDRWDSAHCIESVGKRAGDETGKYPVNKIDEEILRSSRTTTGQVLLRNWFHVIASASEAIHHAAYADGWIASSLRSSQ
jgi:hypothetical protein